MATIIDDTVLGQQVNDPAKDIVSVQSKEIAPDPETQASTPEKNADSLPSASEPDTDDSAPAYETVGEAPEPQFSEISAQGFPSKKRPQPPHMIYPMPGEKPKGPGFTLPPPDAMHPVLPSGEVWQDVRTHLKCQQIFSANIERLLKEYMSMKTDLTNTRKKLSQTEQNLRHTTRERDQFRGERDDALDDLNLANKNLERVKKDLEVSQRDLTNTREQVRELGNQLEKTKIELRAVKREVIAQKEINQEQERELAFRKTRIDDLEVELHRANMGENAANDRNTELTKMLYHIEAEKALIERSKDAAEESRRRLESDVRDRDQTIAELNKRLKK